VPPVLHGKQHILDIQGRVDRFNKRYAKSDAASATAEAAKSH